MKYLFIALGFVSTGLGLLGVALPVLPTVPFLLLASFCFAKGSKRFHDKFINTKLYKNHLESFEKDMSMTLKAKICLLAPVSAMLILAFLAMDNIYGRVTIIALMIIKYLFFIFKVKTKTS